MTTVNDDIILDFQHVTKRFPGVTALDDVSLTIRRGEIHGLCGENGAGKSTLMKILSGVYPAGTYEGTIIYDGHELDLSDQAIQQATAEGIAIVYQELTLVPTMTVGANVYLGREPIERGGINWDKLYADTSEILDRYGLEIEAQSIVQHLGVGKMQMTEIAKALSNDAKILILDEPTSALTKAEIDKLMDMLETLREHGVTCIYITHKLDEFFRITDNITVLRDGKLITTQPTSELTQEKLVSYMVGRDMTERFPQADHHAKNVVMQVRNLHAKDPISHREILHDVNFELRAGEIFGIAGLMGSGRTELVMTIFGEYGQITQGEIELDGKLIHPKSSRDAMQAGIGLVPEDRKEHGLVLIQTILKNISLANLDQFSTWYSVDELAELDKSLEYAKSLSIKTPSLHVPVSSLSGGNQQKVVISKWLMSSPKVLILDDPTRGIDVGAKYEIYKLMHQLADEGMAIIMISSELEEVLGMSDRVMVMHEGHSSGILDITEATQENIMALATGLTVKAN